MMIINNKYEIGDMVFVKTDSDQKSRQIVALFIQPEGAMKYLCCCGTDEKYFFEIELTAERDCLIPIK